MTVKLYGCCVKLFALGGTVFLGRHSVAAALAQDHAVTLFNRGQHNADLFPAVKKLHGDRDGDLAALCGRRWDAVIDTSGYLPRVVRVVKSGPPNELLARRDSHFAAMVRANSAVTLAG